MSSLYLNKLTSEDRENLEQKLWELQGQMCFICEQPIERGVQQVQIDHVIPIKVEGKDNPSNFAVTHSQCNASKQDADLRVARVLARFSKIREVCLQTENRGPNLSDVLKQYGGSEHELPVENISDSQLKYSLPATDDQTVYEERIHLDKLSGFRYFFAELPIQHLFHDDRINPRSIGNVAKLVKEFYSGRPQLHVALGWLDITDGHDRKVRVFDGQHKAAAQILLGTRRLPVRIFLNPDRNVLLTANTHAGSTLRQVAFDKSVQRHLGSALYVDRVERYQRERDLPDDDYSFSERDLVNYYKGEAREMKRYILDAVRDGITHHQNNKLQEFVDLGGRGKEKPLSYSTIEKTFYSFFIYQDVLDTPINYGLDEGENPRQLEKEQIVTLMNLIAEGIFVGKFDPGIGTSRIENKIQNGEDIPENHLVAYRMSKEEIIYNWLRFIRQLIQHFFIMQGKPIQEGKMFQYRFPQPLWDRVEMFVQNLSGLPVWVNRELASTVFGGKQNYEYWQVVFETAKTPQGYPVLAIPLDLMDMITA